MTETYGNPVAINVMIQWKCTGSVEGTFYLNNRNQPTVIL